MILLKGGKCHDPCFIGVKDILTAFDRILLIENSIPSNLIKETTVLDCTGMTVCPGFIDQHVHFTGGGGENGPASRIPEIMLGDILAAGVTTAVGVLGADSVTRSMETLLAKAEALESEGISTYIYTGSYSIPTATLMGKPIKDIALIKKVIGVGEVAIADSRSPYPDISLLKELAYEALVGGMLGGKAGVMHIHVGDGKDGLGPLFKLLDETDFPVHMFVPTHLNRNRKLFNQALEYGRKGGNIDLTAGESSENGVAIPDAFIELLNAGVNIERITFSSDGNGSCPYSGNNGGDGVGKIRWLLDDIKKCVYEKNIPFEQTLKVVTSNVAKILKLFPGKGTLQEGSFADILVLDSDLNVRHLVSRGIVMIENGIAVKRGNYEGQ